MNKLLVISLLLICGIVSAFDELPFFTPSKRKDGRAPIRADFKSIEESGADRTHYAEFFGQVPIVNTVGGPEGHHVVALSSKDSYMDTLDNSKNNKFYIPRNLYHADGTISYTRFKGRDNWGVSVTGGSSSNKPFYSIKETDLQSTAIYRHYIDDKRTIIFLLNYSNNRAFLNNIPIPGVLYATEFTSKFGGAFGIPILYLWARPIDNMMINLLLLPPYLLQVRASYAFAGPWQVYSFFNMFPKSYFVAERTDRWQRLFFDEKKVSLGVKGPVNDWMALDLSAGYAFDRRFFLGNRYTDRDKNPREMSHNLFFSAEAKFTF
ncbi:MAG: hypothetical protein WCG27_13185 [Pseudomonadota bacterium]